MPRKVLTAIAASQYTFNAPERKTALTVKISGLQHNRTICSVDWRPIQLQRNWHSGTANDFEADSDPSNLLR
jgi:hypothetical protein